MTPNEASGVLSRELINAIAYRGDQRVVVACIDDICSNYLNKLVEDESLFTFPIVPSDFRSKLHKFLAQTDFPQDVYEAGNLARDFSKDFIRKLILWARYKLNLYLIEESERV